MIGIYHYRPVRFRNVVSGSVVMTSHGPSHIHRIIDDSIGNYDQLLRALQFSRASVIAQEWWLAMQRHPLKPSRQSQIRLLQEMLQRQVSFDELFRQSMRIRSGAQTKLISTNCQNTLPCCTDCAYDNQGKILSSVTRGVRRSHSTSIKQQG